MTTARVANSSVVSMPLKILISSAALAAGPVMCTASAGSPADAVAFSPLMNPLTLAL